MAEDHLTFLSYLGGAVLSAAMLLVSIYLQRIKVAHPSLLIAALVSVVWGSVIALNYYPIGSFKLNLEKIHYLIIETLRYGAWISASLFCLKQSSGHHLPRRFLVAISGLWLVALSLALVLWELQHPFGQSSSLLTWNNLILSITGLVTVEQLYKNSSHLRLSKLLSVSIGAMFSYDIYLFSYSLIFNQLSEPLWQARGAINGCAALIMALGSLALARQAAQRSKIALSRPVAFYTTSLSAAGGFLTFMAIGGYYVQLYGGQWGTMVQVILLFLALTTIAIVFISQTARSWLNVWINKHFFHHKYDYRVEWLRLINALSRSEDVKDFQQQALDVVSSIFKSPAAGLWLLNGNHFAFSSNKDLPLPTEQLAELQEPANSKFCQLMREEEWVFAPRSPLNEQSTLFNQHLPEWLIDMPKIWLVMPLLTEDELLGFMLLTAPPYDHSLNWEDLDLAKTVGRQVASYLDRHHAAEQLAESRQFDTFNKLAAFIMHDLKNLIAQQALVVDNAAKHKDNPAFVEDAIRTIDNSVGRMSTLLKKLQQNETSELRTLDLDQVLIEAIKKSQPYRPTPTLRRETEGLKVNADFDRLIMTVTHIIKNAQEATDNSGFVDVTLRQDTNNAIISIEDNGDGMTPEFIKEQLFKPFVTTKSGKGMGIGVYQAKEYIGSLGGSVSVESSIGEGSTFTLSLPITQG
jgi:putative PEP-CTERM system histidine kinase